MSTFEQIRRPVAAHVAEYERFLGRYMRSDNPLVEGMLDYILQNGGKGIRPVLVLLAAAVNDAGAVDTQSVDGRTAADHKTIADHKTRIGMRTYLGAMLVEMMHTASLVHDDVIDHSDLRRGKPSGQAKWGSRSAVIMGDFILARSLVIGLDSAQYDIVDYVVRAMGELCEGELIQSAQSRAHTMTREIYLDIIGKKTAVLFGVSAGVGALSVGAPREKVAAMREFGEALGMAFQIRDDILDYDVSAATGKPSCGDLREGKITLPLLAVLERSSPELRAELLSRLPVGEGGAADSYAGMLSTSPEAAMGRDMEKDIEYLHDVVVREGGLAEAEKVMHAYIARAHAALAGFGVSPAAESLALLASYAAERNN